MSSRDKILTLNSWSSSLKFKLFELASHVLKPIAWGVCERIGEIASSGIKVRELQRLANLSLDAFLLGIFGLLYEIAFFNFRCIAVMGASMESMPHSQTTLLP